MDKLIAFIYVLVITIPVAKMEVAGAQKCPDCNREFTSVIQLRRHCSSFPFGRCKDVNWLNRRPAACDQHHQHLDFPLPADHTIMAALVHHPAPTSAISTGHTCKSVRTFDTAAFVDALNELGPAPRSAEQNNDTLEMEVEAFLVANLSGIYRFAFLNADVSFLVFSR